MEAEKLSSVVNRDQALERISQKVKEIDGLRVRRSVIDAEITQRTQELSEITHEVLGVDLSVEESKDQPLRSLPTPPTPSFPPGEMRHKVSSCLNRYRFKTVGEIERELGPRGRASKKEIIDLLNRWERGETNPPEGFIVGDKDGIPGYKIRRQYIKKDSWLDCVAQALDSKKGTKMDRAEVTNVVIKMFPKKAKTVQDPGNAIEYYLRKMRRGEEPKGRIWWTTKKGTKQSYVYYTC